MVIHAVFVIKKLWIDKLENEISAAMGYSVIGFCDTKEEAKAIAFEAGSYEGTGWPVERGKTAPNIIFEMAPRISVKK